MAIKYIHTRTGEKVDKEPWRWQALFASGSTLDQFEIVDGKPRFNPIQAVIDRHNAGDPVVALRLTHDQHPYMEVYLPADSKPIHMYKRALKHHHQVVEGGKDITWEEQVRWYVIGYQLGKMKAGLAVTDADRVIMTMDLDSLKVTSKGEY